MIACIVFNSFSTASAKITVKLPIIQHVAFDECLNRPKPFLGKILDFA